MLLFRGQRSTLLHGMAYTKVSLGGRWSDGLHSVTIELIRDAFGGGYEVRLGMNHVSSVLYGHR
eukprot:2125383-Alexandrium_andersonii.AAC.1